MAFLYDLSIRLYYVSVKIASAFQPKARAWIVGRKLWESKLKSQIDPNVQNIWVHCASLGEFEQGRPVIEGLKKQFPEHKIVLSFFSPSGYEVRKNYPGADHILYLPLDTKKNARAFVEIVKPSFAIFIKYEFWFNFIDQLYKKGIPIFSVSTIFRKKQHFFGFYGSWFTKQLKKINFFFVQNENSLELLRSINIENAIVSGDTRFDRVADISKQSRAFPEIEKFIGNDRVLLVGSSWPVDEKIIRYFFENKPADVKIIIAPHEVDKGRIISVSQLFEGSCVLLSDIQKPMTGKEEVLIVDSIGILSHLYKYASLAYIGGAFGAGLHNILEAATFGKPVLFGPGFTKFQEARDLVRLGGVFSIHDREGFSNKAKFLFSNREAYQIAADICRNYTSQNQGATDIIVHKLSQLLQINPASKDNP
jgi:3-deoxy-D-manno-octulosonic-acid transferase